MRCGERIYIGLGACLGYGRGIDNLQLLRGECNARRSTRRAMQRREIKDIVWHTKPCIFIIADLTMDICTGHASIHPLHL